MAIPQAEIRAARGTVSESRVLANTKLAARAARLQTAFLCHSHKDQDLVIALQDFLWRNGWKVYVDWQDTTMPEKPNRQTAEKIQAKIHENDWFLFLATANSMASRWCPWEIGYADAAKGKDDIVVIPTRDAMGSHGNEYIDLYRRIDLSPAGRIVEFSAGVQSNYHELTTL
jgi:TIR domain